MWSNKKGSNTYKLKGGNVSGEDLPEQTQNQDQDVPINEVPIRYTDEYPKESTIPPSVSNRPTYETIQSGTFLYHPSQDIKRFSNSMIFVDVRNVLDKNQQRSFSIFFTPNEEYARRYSGLWSLNKRPVYVHKLQVSRPISGIKIFDASLIPDNMDNLEFSKNICGPSEDGTINGIKVTLPNNGGHPISEYYICNPESWFIPVETWMQYGPTEWIKISNDNKNSIMVPDQYSNQPVPNVTKEQNVMNECDDPENQNEDCYTQNENEVVVIQDESPIIDDQGNEVIDADE